MCLLADKRNDVWLGQRVHTCCVNSRPRARSQLYKNTGEMRKKNYSDCEKGTKKVTDNPILTIFHRVNNNHF